MLQHREVTLSCYSDITTELSMMFSGDPYICWVYGSFASNQNTSSSDIDFFVACEHPSMALFDKVRAVLDQVSQKHLLTIDAEVPFENKLLVSFDDVMRATKLEPFLTPAGYNVSPIQKSDDFLASAAMRQRLIFNSLTTPHEYVSGDWLRYVRFRFQAEHSLVTLVAALQTGNQTSIDEAIQTLLSDDNENSGEMYLGYKDKSSVRAYLAYILTKCI